jgi:hypothetical protein
VIEMVVAAISPLMLRFLQQSPLAEQVLHPSPAFGLEWVPI